MALEPGSQLGSYQVVAAIGRGGMGEVYRALDARLGREVAIKILPDEFARDPDRLARFQREARVLGSLNHPNIAHVYGLEEAAGTFLLVMELVEGPTLFERLAEGALPTDEAVAIAGQIADALESAHAQGIIHRDLKPSNVKVRDDGTVKVLDFGLAKALGPGIPSPDLADLPTITSPAMTRHGAILGTAAYMSPEQTRGKPLDRRTDIWAFGCVLFEMLGGRRAFDGATVPDVVVAVLSKQPDWNVLSSSPPHLVRLVRNCLEKDPKRRLRDIGDARLDMEPAGITEVPPVAPRRQVIGWWPMTVIGGLAAASLVVWFLSRPEPGNTQWQQRSLVTSPSEESGSRISPDGRWASFLSSAGGVTQLMVQRIDGGEVKPVALPEGRALSHVWSPDGNSLAYALRQDAKSVVQVVKAFFGGVPSQSIAIPAAANPNDLKLLRWVGQTIYASVGRSLYAVDLGRGTTTNISNAWKIQGLRSFDVSADGRRVAFTAFSDGQEDLWVANLDASGLRRLTSDKFLEYYPLWSSESKVIFQSNRGGQVDLWQVDLDSDRFVQLTSSETYEEPESVSADGKLISFRQISAEAGLWTWNAADKTFRQLTNDALSDLAPTSSSDGTNLVFQRGRRTVVGEPLLDSTLFFGVLDGLRFSREPIAVVDGFAASLAPDGSRIAYFQAGSAGSDTLFLKHLQSGTTLTLSTTTPRPSWFPPLTEWTDQNLAWAQHGTELYFVDRPDVFAIRRYRTDENAPDPPLVKAQGPRELIHDLHVSSSGILAYLSKAGSNETLHIVDAGTGNSRATVPLDGTVSARGWLAGDSGLVLVQARASRFNEDFTTDVEVVVASSAGALRRIGVIPQAFPSTARLDPARSVLHVVRIEGGLQNLFEFSLANGSLRRLTESDLPGVRFSGIEVLGSSGFVAVRRERRSDIWVLEAASRLLPVSR